MRKDFGRVVIERPRIGSSARGLKIRKTGRLDLSSANWGEWDYEGPTRISYHGPSDGGSRLNAWDGSLCRKNFTDVLGPVRGYLKSKIGRPWTQVHSELCRTLGHAGYAIRHVLDQHILSEIDINTWIEDGRVHGLRWYCDYYVHPKTGLICEETRGQHHSTSPAYNRHHWKDGLWFVLMNNIWYFGSYVRIQYGQHNTWRGNLTSVWPDVQGWRFIKWRQAGKKDLKVLRQMLQNV